MQIGYHMASQQQPAIERLRTENRAAYYLSRLSRRNEVMDLPADMDTLKILAAQPLIQSCKSRGLILDLHEAEFKVFSQFGDDGIIQYLVHRLQCLPDTFVEFGVGNYRESNTRFLLLNNNWRGLVLDEDESSINFIHEDEIYWRHTLTARRAFITRENIDELLREAGFAGQIGLLSIDIDGNDYWVWENIAIVDPVIVIVEYNSTFGPNLAITIPYEPHFARHQAHYSGQFWGASLRALKLLADRKGYSLVGCNSAGNNAYFVRNNKVADQPVLSVQEAFVESRFRDSRNEEGKLTYLTGAERFHAIAELEVYDLWQDRIVPLGSLRGVSIPS
jgi:hypothetical protein